MTSKSRVLCTQVAPCILLFLDLPFTHALPSVQHARDTFGSHHLLVEREIVKRQSVTSILAISTVPPTSSFIIDTATSSTSTTSTSTSPSPSPSNFTSNSSNPSISFPTSSTGIPFALTFGNNVTSTGSATLTPSGSVAAVSATTFSSPADTPTQSSSSGMSGTSGPPIGAAVAGSLLGVLIVVGCGLYWRKRRRRTRESEKGRVEAPFGAPPQLVINTAPNQSGIQPYVFAPTSANSYLSPQSATTLLMKPSSKELAAMANGGTPSSPNPLLSPGFEQQSLMEQLNALKQHIRQVEAQVARNGSVNGPGGGGTQDNSEPPPEYVATSLEDGTRTRTRTTEKSRRS